MRRASDVGDVLHGVGRCVDEIHGIRADRDDGQCVMIGRESQAVYQQLASIERTKTCWQRIPEPDHTEQLVIDRIGDRDCVRELLGGIDPIAVTDRNVGIGGGARDLPGPSISPIRQSCRNQEDCQIRGALHVTAPCLVRCADWISYLSRCTGGPDGEAVASGRG